jgi:hypothetical protein
MAIERSAIQLTDLELKSPLPPRTASKIFLHVRNLICGFKVAYIVDKNDSLDGPARIAQECSVKESDVRAMMEAFNQTLEKNSDELVK